MANYHSAAAELWHMAKAASPLADWSIPRWLSESLLHSIPLKVCLLDSESIICSMLSTFRVDQLNLALLKSKLYLQFTLFVV